MAIKFLNTVSVDTDALYVDAANNRVGIGTASPGHLLEINGTGDALSVGDDTNTSTYMRFANERTMIGYSGADAVIQGGASKGIKFNVNNSTFNSGNAMAIIPSGNVGIGTTSPAEKLEVSGGHVKITNSGNASLYINANNSGSDATIFFEELDSVKAKIQHDASNDSMLFTDGSYTDTMTLKSGNVGIGTTSPQSKLHIETGSGGTYNPNVNHDDVTIEGNGNIGLQLFSPATSYQYISFGDPDSVNAGYLRYYHGTNEMVFRTNGSDTLTIDSSGRVKTSEEFIATEGHRKGFRLVANYGNWEMIASASANQLILHSESLNEDYLTIKGTGVVQLNDYGSGSNTGTATQKLAVDSSGNVIEIPIGGGAVDGSGTANTVTMWSDADTITDAPITISGNNATFSGDLTVSGGDISLGGTGRIQGVDTVLSSTDAANKAYVDSAIAAPTAPAAPTTVTTSVVGETIEVAFNQSATANIDYYQVWSADPGGSFGIIAQIAPGDFASTMTVVDTSFNVSGTISYRVYAVKLGIYSTAATSTQAFSASALSVTAMTVVNLNTAYYIQYEKPSSRFIDNIEIYMDSQTTQAALNRSNASIVYSGQNASYMRNVGASNNFHQFWVEVTTT